MVSENLQILFIHFSANENSQALHILKETFLFLHLFTEHFLIQDKSKQIVLFLDTAFLSSSHLKNSLECLDLKYIIVSNSSGEEGFQYDWHDFQNAQIIVLHSQLFASNVFDEKILKSSLFKWITEKKKYEMIMDTNLFLLHSKIFMFAGFSYDHFILFGNVVHWLSETNLKGLNHLLRFIGIQKEIYANQSDANNISAHDKHFLKLFFKCFGRAQFPDKKLLQQHLEKLLPQTDSKPSDVPLLPKIQNEPITWTEEMIYCELPVEQAENLKNLLEVILQVRSLKLKFSKTWLKWFKIAVGEGIFKDKVEAEEALTRFYSFCLLEDGEFSEKTNANVKKGKKKKKKTTKEYSGIVWTEFKYNL